MWSHDYAQGRSTHGWHGHHAHGPDFCFAGYGAGTGFRSKREIVRKLEEYQKDLEQEIADVADRISELKQSVGEV